ncbi:MAG: ABC transporter permease [Cyclobacteriaceae bacterium]|nr:ABC transporter permease [Cyclobacteriaceae bacterium]
MLKNYLKTTIRNLWKNRLFAVINVSGMGIALACCIVAYFNYDFNYSYDENQINKEHIFRVNILRNFQGEISRYGIAPMPVGGILRENKGDIRQAIRFIPSQVDIRIKEDVFKTNMAYADREFFEVFTLPLIYGTPDGLADQSTVYISDELALKYFGETDVVGAYVAQITNGEIKDYVVGGVYKKFPPNSSFYFEALTLFDNFFDNDQEASEDNWRNWNTLFLHIPEADRVAVVEKELQKLVADQNAAREDFQVASFYLDSFVGIAPRSESEDVMSHWLRQGLPTPAVITPVVMAILILLIACFNFTNTSIAISSRRLKEIGIRKVMGGLRSQLIAQFMAENLLLSVLALMVGLLIAEFLVPAYSSLWPFLEIKINYFDNPGFLMFLVLLLFFTGLMAGSYPAFYISKFRPTSILKGNMKLTGTNYFTSILLTLQYSISLLAIVLAIAFNQNARYQEELDYGYEKDGVIFSYLGNSDDVKKYRNALSENTDILEMAGTKHNIFYSYYNDPVEYEGIKREVDIMDVSDSYFSASGMSILHGRNFRPESETDYLESVIVNEEMVRSFGWNDPLGKRVVWDTLQLYVIGVVKDFYTQGLWNPINPMMMRYAPEGDHRFLVVKSSPQNIQQVDDFMRAKWKTVFPLAVYNGVFLNEEMESASLVNRNIITIFTFLGLVATLMSAIGLYSLVSLNILKKMKEIGVRKVLGAGMLNIAHNINREFLITLSISSVLGVCAGYFMNGLLMESIWAYYKDADISTFIISVLLIFFVSALSISYKVIRAALINPVNALRSE